MKIIADSSLREKSSAPSKIPKREETQGTGIKILTPKQMMPLALAQVKAGKSNLPKSCILCIAQNKLLKQYIMNSLKYNEFIKIIIKNGCHTHEF